MDITEIEILLRLLIAHLLADFLFQTNSMIRSKRRNCKWSVKEKD
ncbi:MAG: hypothetical protein COW03_06645 [Cytophagales bacterium CG12_big_fil_rev_8_21_14_0_65_40_12]|nr:MAG: hypothetical protein COW03_06645 [Cytophagales bacterium CG12_big_fil_rev_8_21_14_0_65_40_12]PIW03321.1 MAG: hypothetical protein COW40_15800 [Cytophagales bacterium CG17_big_fil_post_rev_8_21_14_2_50_40_13]